MWKEIPGFKSYNANKKGQIWSSKTNKILSTKKCWKYPHVRIKNNKNKFICKNVHDLILITFIGPKPKGLEVLHRNGNKKDNRLCNLRYGTAKENAQDKFKHGYRHPAGYSNKLSKFNREERKIIKQMLQKYSMRCVALFLNTTHATISNSIKRD